MHSTQLVCPLHVNLGACVSWFQRRTVVSPEPEARCLPSGENWHESTASAWPGIADEHRVTGLTRNSACG